MNKKKENKLIAKAKRIRNRITAATMAGMLAVTPMIGAFADGFDSVTPTATSASATSLMGKIIGILLTITRFVGVALVIYGVYEIVMSFMQNQPEAKTKGIVMALAGVVMIALKSILQSVGVVG